MACSTVICASYVCLPSSRTTRPYAADAARNNLDYTRFLLALAEQEVNQREHNMVQRRIKAAHFPVFKELADFDFSAIPSLNKAQILDLARGEYVQKRESMIFIGNPGLGKTHLGIGLALACLPPETQSALLDSCQPGQRTPPGSR